MCLLNNRLGDVFSLACGKTEHLASGSQRIEAVNPFFNQKFCEAPGCRDIDPVGIIKQRHHRSRDPVKQLLFLCSHAKPILLLMYPGLLSFPGLLCFLVGSAQVSAILFYLGSRLDPYEELLHVKIKIHIMDSRESILPAFETQFGACRLRKACVKRWCSLIV